jgi:hypothetical protein
MVWVLREVQPPQKAPTRRVCFGLVIVTPALNRKIIQVRTTAMYLATIYATLGRPAPNSSYLVLYTLQYVFLRLLMPHVHAHISFCVGFLLSLRPEAW